MRVRHRNTPRPGPSGWTNWAGNQSASPLLVERPTSEEQLVDAVRRSVLAGRQVRAVGTGHSFTAAAVAEQTLLDLSGYCTIRSADQRTGRVTVDAGITLESLNTQLHQRGLAMANLGDIAYQTVSGAISTGTHGTGARLGGLATQVVEMTVVTGSGQLTTLTGDDLRLAVVGLGAFGIISTLTLQCVPAFRLHVVNQPMKLDKVFAEFEELVDTNDHFEFYLGSPHPVGADKAQQPHRGTPAASIKAVCVHQRHSVRKRGLRGPHQGGETVAKCNPPPGHRSPVKWTSGVCGSKPPGVCVAAPGEVCGDGVLHSTRRGPRGPTGNHADG